MYNRPYKITSSEQTSYKLIKYITKLIEDLETQLRDLRSDQINFKIAKKTIEILNQYHKEHHSPEKLLNLLLTGLKIFNIITHSADDQPQEEIKDFFKERENLLKGDTLDYCFSNCLANRLCYGIARIIFPSLEPYSVLLKQALTENREQPWLNPYTMTNDLPKSPFDFFRTPDNKIHLYEGILQKALAVLQTGEQRLSEVWQGTDDKQSGSLGKLELDILKQRSNTFKLLIEYTRKLNVMSGNAMSQPFLDLAKGLQEGGGHGLNATEPSYKALDKFFEWWNELPEELQITMKSLISYQFVPFTNDPINYLQTIKDECTQILSNKVYSMARIVTQNAYLLDTRAEFSMQEVEDYCEKITRELERPPRLPIQTDKNVFREYLKNKPLKQIIFELNLSMARSKEEREALYQYIPGHSKGKSSALLFSAIDYLKEPAELINLMADTFTKEKENPNIIKRTERYESGFRWQNQKVSGAWAGLTHQAKNKVLSLTKKEVQKDDAAIRQFLEEPRGKWCKLFKRRPTSIKTYEFTQRALTVKVK